MGTEALMPEYKKHEIVYLKEHNSPVPHGEGSLWNAWKEFKLMILRKFMQKNIRNQNKEVRTIPNVNEKFTKEK